jgi:hypothetical protein
MATFIKAGFWETLCAKCTGYKGWLNLDKFVESKVPQPAYKVYTALVTQSGGDSPSEEYTGEEIYAGITYYIFTNDDNFDLVQYGAPNSNVGTYFVCNQNATLPDDFNIQLNYNTGAPVVTVLENTIGNIWFEYSAVGKYILNSTNAFTNGGTWTLIENSGATDNIIGSILYVNSNVIWLYSFDGGIQSDNILNNTPIEIRVYN